VWYNIYHIDGWADVGEYYIYGWAGVVEYDIYGGPRVW
jgi:hypothetical protein